MGRGRRAWSQPWSFLHQLESAAASVSRSMSTALRWSPEMGRMNWPEIDFSVIETIIWPLVMAVETVALATLIGFYLAFCGCNF